MAPVGVPGLILGGGISHFASKLGWACDNVVSFELVTASGLAIEVTPKSSPDLFWALRGGGNNFGIVTNFKLTTFPLGQMWGGQRIYLENSFPSILDAIHQFTVTGSSKDVDAAQIVVGSSRSIILKIKLTQHRHSPLTPVLEKSPLPTCTMRSQFRMHQCSIVGTTSRRLMIRLVFEQCLEWPIFSTKVPLCLAHTKRGGVLA